MSGAWWRCNPRLIPDDKLMHLTGVDRELFDRLVWLLEPAWEQSRAARIEEGRAKKRLVRRNQIGAGKPSLPFPSRLFVVLLALRTNMPLRTIEAQWGVGKDLVSRSVRQVVEIIAGLGVTGPSGERLDDPALAALLAAMAAPRDGASPDAGDGDGTEPPSGPGVAAGDLVGGDVVTGGVEDASGAVIIDGTFTRVGRPRGWEAQKRLYNAHRGCHCLVYQACCDLEGRLLWVSEPFPGATHDLTALAATPLAAHLAASGAPLLVDKGYQGVVERLGLHAGRVFLPHRKPRRSDLSDDDAGHNRVLASLRIKIEHVNEQLKNWKVLGYYRGRRSNFGPVLQAIAVLVTLHHRVTPMT